MPVVVFSLCCLIWSTTYYAIRVCLRGYAPLTGAAIRFFVAALVLTVAVRAVARLLGDSGRGAESRRERVAIAAAALLNAVSYSVTYYAETRITGGTAAVLTAASPFFATMAAVLAGLERFQARKLFGIALGFAGVTLLFWEGAKGGVGGLLRDAAIAIGPGSPDADRRAQLWAMAAMIATSALLWPSYNVVLKRFAGGVSSGRANLRFLFWTAAWLSLFALVLERRSVPTFGLKPTAALLYLAVMGTVVAWSGYFWMLKRLDISTLSTMTFIQPLLALLVDVVMGDDRLTRRGYLGAALVLGGVLLSAVKWRARASCDPSAAAPEPAPALATAPAPADPTRKAA